MHFLKEHQIKKINKENQARQNFNLQSDHAEQLSINNRHEKRAQIMLEELSIDESVELVLYHTDREIDEYDFWHDPSEFDENFNIKEQMKEESVIQ